MRALLQRLVDGDVEAQPGALALVAGATALTALAAALTAALRL